MPMETLGDDLPQRDASKSRLFTQVLSYDDLLADRAATYRLDDTTSLRIGRGEKANVEMRKRASSDLQLVDPWVSSGHAEITLISETVFLKDLGSRNGTFVNGVRVQECKLADGDLLE